MDENTKLFFGSQEFEELYLSFNDNQAEMTEPVIINPTIASLRMTDEYNLHRLDHFDYGSSKLDEKTERQI